MEFLYNSLRILIFCNFNITKNSYNKLQLYKNNFKIIRNKEAKNLLLNSLNYDLF